MFENFIDVEDMKTMEGNDLSEKEENWKLCSRRQTGPGPCGGTASIVRWTDLELDIQGSLTD